MPIEQFISIEHLPVRFGPGLGQFRYFVCYRQQPMGQMFDFYERGALKNPYPFRDGQGQGFLTADEAEKAYQKMMNHICEVCELEPKKRKGSSTTW